MSREIKFRAWDGKQMLTEENFDFVVSDYGSIIGLNEYGWTEHGVDCVEQYTGLKDKNGKEIYEGDIVKWLDGLNEYIEFKVEWQDNRARFCLRNEYSVFDYEDLNNKKKPYIEVIGNIHENPELIA